MHAQVSRPSGASSQIHFCVASCLRPGNQLVRAVHGSGEGLTHEHGTVHADEESTLTSSSDPCAFCAKFSIDADVGQREWFDEILAQTKDFVLVPGVGALVQGYTLIVARKHYRTMASVGAPELAEFLDFVAHISDELRKLYGPLLLFEHGSATPQVSKGTCIEHAHWQILPLPTTIWTRLESDRMLIEVRDFRDVACQLGWRQSYLYIQDSEGICKLLVQNSPIPSQLLRREIADALGRPQEWDWALFPNWGNLRATIRDVRALHLSQ